MSKRLSIVLAVAVLLVMFVSGSAFAATYELIFPVNQSLPYNLAGAETFKNFVEVESGGDISVVLIPWETLGTDREVVDQIRLGEAHVHSATTGGLAGVTEDIQWYNMPFLFENRYVAWLIMLDPEHVNFVRERMLEGSGGTLRLLGAAENSIRMLYTKRGPIRVPEDLTEYAIKMRTPEIPLYVELFEALGSVSVLTVPSAERYTALQTGLIDGTEGGLSSAWGAGLLEVTDYVTLTGHMFDYHYYIINNDIYQEMPPDYQEIIDMGGALAVWVQNVETMRDGDRALELMAEAGKVIYAPTPAETAQWMEIGQEVGERFLGELVSDEFKEETAAAVARARERITAFRGLN